MKTEDFYYDLPDELIAQHPASKRDEAKLLCLNKKTKQIQHRKFYDIIDFLNAGDCLVMNDTRVLPARIYGKKETGARVEFLLAKEMGLGVWDCLCKPAKRAKVGDIFKFSDNLFCEILEIKEEGLRKVKFKSENSNFYDALYQVGQMPLPPYIKEKLENEEEYQTVYSDKPTSSAAPTAGLHFTKELLDKIEKKGIKKVFLTLDVGLGTFRPVKTNDIEQHKMHSEHYNLGEKQAEIINETRKSGGRIIAVGTTVVRTLETIYEKYGEIRADDSDSSIFIYPPKKVQTIDALITNFHLPESTLIMLVSSFAGYETTMKTYKNAVEEKYRFFSFGDAMYIY
ncbi:MAG: tRNA preQ1(34) S-adenosylmethionine ribosyltransferase-isomerase QueA [Clostridia bacterium]|nr:tRNA preQ1(34) S-adenosylmethionine ribosyltransferase-isomerase QueA [Clostridia bacterium]